MEPGHLPPALGGRAGLPGHGAGELVSWLQDRPGQRASPLGRHVRALGRPGREARPRAVVLPDHGLRRRAPRGPRRAGVARAGQGHATQLDRTLRGSRVRPRRGGPPGSDRAGVHDPPRHQLRHDLRRHGTRTPACRRAHHRCAAAGRRGASPTGRAGDRYRADGRRGRDDARHARCLHRHERCQSLQRPAGTPVRGRLRPHGLRHRGDHGRAGRGRARLDLRHLAWASHRPHRPATGRLGGGRWTAPTRARV